MRHLIAKDFWLIYGVGALFMLLSLNFYYVGEESTYPNMFQQLWDQGLWLHSADQIARPPLFHWLVSPLAHLFGWPYVKEIMRILTILATTGTGLMLGWLAFKLSRDHLFAALAATTYLTFFDVFLYHGWLAYVDPIFGFFIFSAIALLWVATHEKNWQLFTLSLLAITCAFLSKSLTAYVFYGSAVFVLIWQRDKRQFLLKPAQIVGLLIALSAPLVWYAVTSSGQSQSTGMTAEILQKLTGANSGAFQLGDYLLKRLSYLLTTLLELFPVAWLAIYVLFSQFVLPKELPNFIRTAGWISLLCYLPYLLSPESSIRYLIPIYPLFALFVAGIIWQAGGKWITRTRIWMIGMLAFQLVLFLVIFPLYQKHYRGENYMIAAHEITRITQGQPLYSNDTSSPGAIVTANLNALRYPLPAITPSPGIVFAKTPEETDLGNWNNGFVITRTVKFANTQIVKRFQLAADEVYLLCRGTACNITTVTPTPPK
jgi:4-amino-4-deoxy-L-arabinose transferase-like glycosyltransferase